MDKQARIEAVRALEAQGLTIQEVLEAIGVPVNENRYSQALEYQTDEVECGMSAHTIVSESDEGAWVLCWRWVDHCEMGEPA